ncbi:DMT family transporter [Mucilaginibacter aquaedulcis]|uniref:DMT family transporter n=1 Tax=Mucilaginibacter aquaedulcis TaxID=1187081 RepID=UPI0025B4F240|nr:DMT family transporter [Mucilaginibacter aquaedulcis]MDN3549159.1 DMT family transporter [Mucilaginibacter aquaedulcis]
MSNTISSNKTEQDQVKGWINGFIAVLVFSGSMPATKAAVLGLSPFFVTVTRGGIAGLLALCALLLFKEKRPQKSQLVSLVIVVTGAVIGFPLLSALALQYITSAHSLVFMGMLPLTTAIFGVIRGGERPHPVFWIFAVLGSLLVIGYAVSQGLAASPIGDILMLISIVLCGLGYAEGAKLSRELGGWQVISWALVLSLPLTIPLMVMLRPVSFVNVGTGAWLGLAYVSVFSMLIGFVFWYRGLAQGGIAAVGQLQLLQPFFGLVLAAYLLHEQVSMGMIGITVCVILCVAGSKKLAVQRR